MAAPDLSSSTHSACTRTKARSGHRCTRGSIYFTTSFVFRDADHAAALFNMERGGHVYSRISNPTNAVLEERVAALEGGVGAIATASGQAALHLAVETIAAQARISSHPRSLRRLAQSAVLYAAALGVQTTFVDPRDLAPGKRAIRRTRSSSSARLSATRAGRARHPSVARDRARREAAAPVDATFNHALPAQAFRPRRDLVYTRPPSSSRPWRSDRRSAGDGGTFDWEASGKFSGAERALRGLPRHGFQEESTVAAFLLRARREGLTRFRRVHEPRERFPDLQGIETLPLRMERHVENTSKVIAFLAGAGWIRSLPRAAFASDHALAKRLLPRGCGAVFTSTSRAGGTPAGALSSLRSFRIWPMSGMRSRW